jgi:hypothetical protein
MYRQEEALLREKDAFKYSKKRFTGLPDKILENWPMLHMVGFMFSEDILVRAIPWPIQSLLVFVLLLVTCHQHWITRYGFPTII